MSGNCIIASFISCRLSTLSTSTKICFKTKTDKAVLPKKYAVCIPEENVKPKIYSNSYGDDDGYGYGYGYGFQLN